jgi:hypothetical protein
MSHVQLEQQLFADARTLDLVELGAHMASRRARLLGDQGQD